jgi:hypothetical protein
MVQRQMDLPVALQRESLLSLAAIGNQFRENLLREVNGVLDQVKFSREAFTGKMKIRMPSDVMDLQPRTLQNFIAALASVFQSGTPRTYTLIGSGMDMVSKHVVSQFLDPRVRHFNVLSISFRKIPGSSSEIFSLLLTPESPRRTEKKRVWLTASRDDAEGRLLKLNGRISSSLMRNIEIWALKDHNYYIRPLEKTDIPALKSIMPDNLKSGFLNGLNRSSDYPRSIFPLLCHRDGTKEIFDSLPTFKIDLSPDIKTRYLRVFDLSRSAEEWVELGKGRK